MASPRIAPPRRLLLVEDDAEARAFLKDLLEREIPGAEVISAASGKTALRLLRETNPHLVMSAQRLGDMGGLDFLARARAEFPRTPRVLLAAFADLPLALRALNEARVSILIQKPFDEARLLRLVEDALDRETARRQGALLLARTVRLGADHRR